MTGSPKVVVVTTVEYRQFPDDGLHAARFRPLGLTAYGPSREDARHNFFTLFRTFIEDTRELGQLETQLDRAGVTWHSVDDFVRTGQPYFDLETLSWTGGHNAQHGAPGEQELSEAIAA